MRSSVSTQCGQIPIDTDYIPWHTGYKGGGGEKVYAEKTECSKILNMENFYMIVHVLLHLFNEMSKIDNM